MGTYFAYPQISDSEASGVFLTFFKAQVNISKD